MAEHLHNLALREKTVDELRALAREYTPLSAESVVHADRSTLIAALSVEAATNGALARTLKKSEIAVKPSFYLMAVSNHEGALPTARAAKARLERSLGTTNARLQSGNTSPGIQSFNIEYVDHLSPDCTEIHLTWQKALRYWSPDVQLTTVYELRFGFAIIDFKERKAIVACHTEAERDVVVDATKDAYGCKLTPMVFTKLLLDQIGSFDKVKRVGYFIDARDRTVPENIAYADERLAAIPIVREEEENARSVRQHSFYRITIGDSVVERGVGVTSGTGKLWIPRETPLTTVRDFAIGLLGKISKTVHALGRKGEVEQVATIMALHALPEVEEISPLELREQVCDLIVQLGNMLLNKERERPFAVPESFAVSAVPRLFNFPALLLTDQDTGATTPWRDENGQTQVRLAGTGGTLQVQTYPAGRTLDTTSLTHPFTGDDVSVSDVLGSLLLVPAPLLHNAVEAGIRLIAGEIDKLSGVTSVPFWIARGTLVLDTKRAFGRSTIPLMRTEINPSDVRELRRLLQSPAPADTGTMMKTLRDLGEKCGSMSDLNCRTCLESKRFICLRSLVARFFRRPLLLAHKSIELSDGQFVANIGGEDVTMFAFAKLSASSKDGLTARNDNGAILLSQVLGQVDKAAFDVALVISPSAINEDLRERLALVCGVFGKKLLILDFPTLARMWDEFQTSIVPFDSIDVHAMLKASRAAKDEAAAAKHGQTKKKAAKAAKATTLV